LIMNSVSFRFLLLIFIYPPWAFEVV